MSSLRSLKRQLGEGVRILQGSNRFNGRKVVRTKSGKIARTNRKRVGIQARLLASLSKAIPHVEVKESLLTLYSPLGLGTED